LQQVDAEHAAVYRDMEPVFEDYYDTGKQMARAYVDEGPSGGNRMMSKFDAAAARLAELVDEFVASAQTRADEALTQQKQMSESAVTQIWISAVVMTVSCSSCLLPCRVR